MTVYLDSSALVKLVVEEPESEDLRAFVGDRAGWSLR
jgi:predicted nucleic acid-binding protein